MLAKRLLELTEEFSAVDTEYTESVANDGEYAGRTQDQIAEEYGAVLREFLTVEPAISK